MWKKLYTQLKKQQFLFEELVKRDFKKKYKRTVLGMFWSVLSPLMMLLVMSIVFTNFFGRNTPHYTIYLFAGQIVYSFYSESTNSGMSSLVANAGIFTKVNVPKYMFLLSKNVSSLINFGLTLLVFFIFVALDYLPFTWKFILLLYPIVCMVIFNFGVGLILSAMFVVFKDIQYLYSIFLQMIMYFSAVFYRIDTFPIEVQHLFYFNPLYVYINYFREIVINSYIPGWKLHFLCAVYALTAIITGGFIYKKYNYKFLYYV